MELILISDSKLKIMLSPDDMRVFELNCDSVDYGNTETRRAFWSILDEAKHRTGFDAASERVYIQLYPSKEGGCEMYVTKIGLPGLTEKAGGPAMSAERELAFAFSSLEILLRVCRQLTTSGYFGEGEAFCDENGQSFLILKGIPNELSGRFAFIGEFGEECDPVTLRAYTDEHCRCICCGGEAVRTLAALV